MRNLILKKFRKRRDFDKEEQIAFALKQVEGGALVSEITRRLGITEATFYRRKQKYGGLLPSEVWKMRQLEGENSHLKRLIVDLTLEKQILQNVISKK